MILQENKKEPYGSFLFLLKKRNISKTIIDNINQNITSLIATKGVGISPKLYQLQKWNTKKVKIRDTTQLKIPL